MKTKYLHVQVVTLSTHFKDINAALYMPAFGCIPYSHWLSEAVFLDLQMYNIYNDTQATESLHLLEYICTVDDWLHSSFIVVVYCMYNLYITACKHVLH